MTKETHDLLSQSYWTRPGEEPPVDAASSNEFPAGASEGPAAIDRRDMLSLMGASLALAGLQGCRRPVETIVPFASAPEDRIPGIPKYYASSMPFGSSAYGVLVESHEGRPTKIEGNDLHPASLGAASAWMQASILGLYDPDRLGSVRRIDPEGSEAASTLASSWDELADFWRERHTAHLDTEGSDLAILSGSHSSPTLARLARELASFFPQARFVVHDPADDDNLFAGIELATGQALRPVFHFDRARVIVALDADPLLAETGAVANARGFAAGRTPNGEMNRLWAIESTLSVTGAAADRRVRLRSCDIPGFTAALAEALAGELEDWSLPPSLPDTGAAKVAPEHAAALEAMARDLAKAGSEGLVVAGRSARPEVHALVYAINSALAAPVTLHPLTDVGASDGAAFGDLVSAMADGQVSSLVILGGNPAYDAPADLGFADALAKVPHSFHLTERENETSALCTWRLPRTHYLESWGDARSIDGTASVVQPLIAPLLGGRSDIELTSLVATASETTGHQLVRTTWMGEQIEDAEAEARWRQTLHDGLVADSSSTPLEVDLRSDELARVLAEIPTERSSDELEITFRPSAASFDGRFANNAWLQEVPDPITKIVWNNAALVSPTTAADLEIETGDVVRISLGDRTLETPVFVLPGQADSSLALTLGYGQSTGRVAAGIGYSAYRLRSSSALWNATGAKLEPVGRREPLIQTQEHWRMEGRHLVREATLEDFEQNPRFAATPEAHLNPVELWPQQTYDEGYQWGMAIDLNRCIGCNACVIACQSENNIPVVGADQVSRGREMHWLRVDRYFEGSVEEPRVVFQPVTCQHCENAPCEQVCPVAATVHDDEGLNVMVYNRCIGTRYCSNNCPYKVRRFNFYNFTKDTPELVKLAMNPDVTVRSRGVMEKCTFCLQRINAAKLEAKKGERTVRDSDLRTACQQTCPADAISFGDVNNPDSTVSAVKQDDRNYLLLAELGNKPRTSYLAKIRNREDEEA